MLYIIRKETGLDSIWQVGTLLVINRFIRLSFNPFVGWLYQKIYLRTGFIRIGYSKDELGGGFHRAKTIDLPINITMDIYRCCLMLFNKFYSGKTVRSISVTLSNIEDDKNQQLSLFEVDNEKRRKLGFVMDGIRSKYGSKAILRAVSYTPAGTALHRAWAYRGT